MPSVLHGKSGIVVFDDNSLNDSALGFGVGVPDTLHELVEVSVEPLLLGFACGGLFYFAFLLSGLLCSRYFRLFFWGAVRLYDRPDHH